MTTAKNVTRLRAEAVLAAVEKKYHSYLLDFGTYVDGNGKTCIDFEVMVEVTNPDMRPKLVESYDGAPYAIVWEGNSPYDWTLDIEYPSTDLETGFKFPAVKLPTTVFVEAINNCVLGIYPPMDF